MSPLSRSFPYFFPSFRAGLHVLSPRWGHVSWDASRGEPVSLRGVTPHRASCSADAVLDGPYFALRTDFGCKLPGVSIQYQRDALLHTGKLVTTDCGL